VARNFIDHDSELVQAVGQFGAASCHLLAFFALAPLAFKLDNKDVRLIEGCKDHG
jgi:hypothetical protein